MKRVGAVLLTLVGCMVGATTEAYATEAAPPSVSVDGLAKVPIPQFASSAEANAAYRGGLTAAIKDGLEKAEFLAAATGVKVGSIQQIIERESSIECVVSAAEGPGVDYASYEGAAPDSGSAEGQAGRFDAVAPEAATRATPPHVTSKKAKKKKHKPKPKAKSSVTATRCTLSAQVVLTYLLT
jgi:hypothetical protein